MFCKKCGKQFDDSSKFCPYCGQKVDEQVPAGAGTNVPPNLYAGGMNNPSYGNAGSKNSQEAKKKKHTVPIVIASVAVILALAGGIFLYIGKPTGDMETRGSIRSSSAENTDKEDAKGSSRAGSSESGNAAVNKSINEVLGYVDQAEEIVSKSYSDLLASDTDESLYVTEKYRQETVILGDSLTELLDLQQQAQTVGGVDDRFAKASKAYFNMVCDSQKAFYEMWVFMTDVMDFDDELLGRRPDIAEYSALDAYYNDLYSWYQSAKNGYSAIDSCPSCLETKWKQYGNVMDLNESIAYKLYCADMFEEDYDYLRMYSAYNMMDRYDIVECNEIDELFDCMEGEIDHFLMQKDVATKLAEEMHSYAELAEAGRGGFEFEYIKEGEINLGYDAVDVIYPSLYNTYDAFLIIKAGCVSGTRKIVVEAEIEGLTQKYKESFTLDPSYTEIYIKPPALTSNLSLASARDAQISVTITEPDGAMIDAKIFPVTVKSKYDVEWYTDEYGVATQDNILCFLTPESPAIAELKRLAIDEISGMTKGTVESFAGYQNVTSWNNYVYTYLQAAGIMRAMYEKGVRYNMDPYSISGSNQHILLPEDVLEQKGGLCIETALVVASALQSANMHVFLVLPPGHAQVAVETWSGSGQYFLIETTCLSSDNNNRNVFVNIGNQLINEGTMAPSGQPIMYLTSEQWYDYLSVDGTYLIDCEDSRILGLTTFAN